MPRQNVIDLGQALASRVERERKTHAAPLARSPGQLPAGQEPERQARWADVAIIDDNPFQPRQTIDDIELQELIAGFDRDGQLVPALARPDPTHPGRLQLVHGHRRKQAVIKGANAGIRMPEPQDYVGKLLVIVREDVSDVEMLRWALDENENRQDVLPLDRARAYVQLREMTTRELVSQGHRPQGEDGLASWRQVAEYSGRHFRQMHRTAQLLQLDPQVQKALEPDENGVPELTERHGRAFLALICNEPKDPQQPARYQKAQRQVLAAVRRHGLNGVKTDMLVQQVKQLLQQRDATLFDERIEEAVKRVLAEKRERAKEENQQKLQRVESHLSLIGSSSNSGGGNSGGGNDGSSPANQPEAKPSPPFSQGVGMDHGAGISSRTGVVAPTDAPANAAKPSTIGRPWSGTRDYRDIMQQLDSIDQMLGSVESVATGSGLQVSVTEAEEIRRRLLSVASRAARIEAGVPRPEGSARD
jgi:ParB/RepB/Spo0J family partition protein